MCVCMHISIFFYATNAECIYVYDVIYFQITNVENAYSALTKTNYIYCIFKSIRTTVYAVKIAGYAFSASSIQKKKKKKKTIAICIYIIKH